MDINEIIDEEKEQAKEPEMPEMKPKSKKKINKKALIVIPIALLLIGAGGYFFLHKSKPNISSVIQGPGGKGIFPPAVNSNQFIKLAVKPNKPASLLLGAPAPVKTKKRGIVTPAKAKSKKAVKAVKAKTDNTLNDLFTVKYKHKAKKNNIPAAPNMQPQNFNVPAIPQNLPNFNLKNMAAKIKNMHGISGNSFNVTGYSGGYVIVQCNKNTKYLKAGESACGYTLLKANSNDATFSHNGKFKKISY
jgi:hypothetical protein